MTDLEKKEFLGQYLIAKSKIERLLEERRGWMEFATRITPSWSDMPKGGAGVDKIQLGVEKIADLNSEIGQEIMQLVELRRRIGAAIESVSHPYSREVLYRRFVRGQKMEQIASDMGYSSMQVGRYLGRGVGEISISG